MKLKDIVLKYGIDDYEFMKFVRVNNLQYKDTFTSSAIPDECVEDYVKMYKEEMSRKNEEKARQELLKNQEIARQEEEEMKKRKAMAEMLITSGFNFDGYKITKYSGYISGDDAVSVARGMAVFGSGPDVKDKLMQSLVTIRRNALAELKEAAYALGCNAVIGVDFDYLTLDPQTANLGGGTTYQPYIFGVTANGNAVIIEKIDE